MITQTRAGAGLVGFAVATLVGALLGVAPAAAAPPTSLSAAAVYPVGSAPVAVAVGDLNGDGIPDLAVANGDGTVSVLLGDGDGTFAPALTYPAGGTPVSLAIADVDGDGAPDIVLADKEGTVSVLRNAGTNWKLQNVQGFDPPVLAKVGGLPASLAVGDLNGDGLPDVVVGGADGTVSVLINTCGGGACADRYRQEFGPVVVSRPSRDDRSVAIGDVDGDGHPDVVVADAAGVVWELPGDGTGALGSPVALIGGGGQASPIPAALAIGDLDQDGSPDIAVANGDGSVTVRRRAITTTILPGDGTASVGKSIAIGDVNGDGFPDLILAETGGSVTVLPGNGDGTFSPAQSFSTGAGAGTSVASDRSIAVADLNRDGEVDIAAVNGDGSVSVLLSQSPPAIVQQPSGVTAVAGQAVSFESAASGRPDPGVQWQVSSDGGVTWSDIAGADKTTLSVVAASGASAGALDGTEYRAVFTNAAGSATSMAALLTVDAAPSVTQQPASATVALGYPVSFTAAASGNPAPSVQWQTSGDGGVTWSDVAGATSSTLSFPAVTAAQTGSLFRAVFANAVGSAATAAATLTVRVRTPVITSISPSSGGSLSLVIIRGQNLGGTRAVSYQAGGTTRRALFLVLSSSTVVAVTPLEARGTVAAVSATTALGTSPPGPTYTYTR